MIRKAKRHGVPTLRALDEVGTAGSALLSLLARCLGTSSSEGMLVRKRREWWWQEGKNCGDQQGRKLFQ